MVYTFTFMGHSCRGFLHQTLSLSLSLWDTLASLAYYQFTRAVSIYPCMDRWTRCAFLTLVFFKARDYGPSDLGSFPLGSQTRFLFLFIEEKTLTCIVCQC